MGWFGPDAGRKPMLHYPPRTRSDDAMSHRYFNFDSGNLDQPGWY